MSNHISEPVWRKSSRSSDPDIGACVELADLGDVVGVRDSKDPGGPILRFRRDELADLLGRVKATA